MSTQVAVLGKLDIIIGLMRQIAETQSAQATSWSLPITATLEEAVDIGTVSGMGFRSKTDLLGKLVDIREAIDEGRRSDALDLINGWIGAIKQAEADGNGW